MRTRKCRSRGPSKERAIQTGLTIWSAGRESNPDLQLVSPVWLLNHPCDLFTEEYQPRFEGIFSS